MSKKGVYVAFIFIIVISFESCTTKIAYKSKLTKPCYNYSIFSRVYGMEISKFEDSFVVLSKVNLNKHDLKYIFNYLGLPYNKNYYGLNLAVSKDLKDTPQTLTGDDIVGATLYHKVLFGLRSKETLYIKKNHYWRLIPEGSEIVSYYFSCSQRYWKMKNIDSTKFKSELLFTLPSKDAMIR